jgi:hypothetical protein
MIRNARLCVHLALLVMLSGVATPGFGADPKLPTEAAAAITRATDFDAAWTSYFGSDLAAYVAVRTPNAEGPLIHSDIDSKALNTVDNPNTPPALTEMSKVFKEMVEEAKKQKLIKKNLSELVGGGFAIGVGPGDATAPSAVVICPSSEALVKFEDWTLTRYRKDHGPDSIKDITIEGVKGIQFEKLEKVKPVVLHDGKVFVFANSADVAGKALVLAKSGKNNVASSKAYQRGRSRVSADALAFSIVAPLPMFDLIQKNTPPSPQNTPEKTKEARASMEHIDSLVFQVVTGAKKTVMSMTGVLNTTDSAFSKFSKMLPTRSLKAATVVDAGIPAFLDLLRPADLSAILDNAQQQQKATVEANLKSVKGQLQAQTGLEYDKDMAPWWGQEIALAVALPPNSPPEGALLLETTDPKATSAAIEKMVGHITSTQGRKFADKTVGAVTVKAAETVMTPQGPSPVNPVVCTSGNYLILGTSMGIVENILKADAKKLAQTPGFELLASNTGTERTSMVMFVKTDLIAKASQAGGPPGQPGGPPPMNPQLKQLVEEVESVGISIGFPDGESMQLNLLFAGR